MNQVKTLEVSKVLEQVNLKAHMSKAHTDVCFWFIFLNIYIILLTALCFCLIYNFSAAPYILLDLTLDHVQSSCFWLTHLGLPVIPLCSHLHLLQPIIRQTLLLAHLKWQSFSWANGNLRLFHNVTLQLKKYIISFLANQD